MASTMEEASRCPRCDQPGDVGARVPSAKAGIDVITVTCRTEGCRWFETGWLIQINPDGSIPDAAAPGEARGEKQFDTKALLVNGVTDEVIEKVNRYADVPNQHRSREI